MEFLIKLRYVILAVARWIFYKCVYRRRFCGPVLGAGPDVVVRIREGGNFFVGRMKSRGRSYFFCDGGSLKIEDGVFMNRGVSINCRSVVTVGAGTIFGESVKIYDHDHLVDQRYLSCKTGFVEAPVTIGKSCWIGANVVILKGVQIPDRTVIGAGSIVTRTVSESGIYAGIGSNFRRLR